LRDQLKRLEDLQRHDAKIQELENSLKAIPMKLAATENDLARVEGLLSSERTALGETERYYAEQKGLMTDDEVQVAGAKHKLAQAKNSKEYMARSARSSSAARGWRRARARSPSWSRRSTPRRSCWPSAPATSRR
jgi:predicted  nucleic acid-binding Zn-ribbon protein